MWAWFKRIFLDGVVTTGEQHGCRPGQIRAFIVCTVCGRVLPHWVLSMTAAEAKERGYLGCKCGNMRVQPRMISSFSAFWWYCVRGIVVRKWIFRKRLFDPRMPILEKEVR